MEKVAEISLEEDPGFIERLINFSSQFTYAATLLSNKYPDPYGKYELLAGIGAKDVCSPVSDSFEVFKNELQKKKEWWFGHVAYDLKNQLERLESENPAKFNYDELCFFQPSYLFIQRRGIGVVEVFDNDSGKKSELLKFLDATDQPPGSFISLPAFLARMSKEDYLEGLDHIKKEIQYGNIYEINFCQEFYAEGVEINPVATFLRLNEKSPMPFAAFYKNKSNYLMCASPERYIQKTGNKIISQPIKGTAGRGDDSVEDDRIKKDLMNDLKEQTENVMIVDLVRNDLSRTAKKASVRVRELFGTYTFPQVHQLISTVESELAEKYHFSDAIKYSFPMGSMTGAPKISAMKIADEREWSRREIYSGTVGYIDPEGDFDFNVVIRSLLYSAENKYLSLTVGGAITKMSDPESEYKECLLKAKAIFEL